jgi:hypothetical protein
MRRLIYAAMLGVLAGCARRLPDGTPEGAFDLFLRAMEETPYDPQAAGRAYHLLAPRARDAIRAQAARAQQITGKAPTPESMFTPTWTPLRFPVDRTHAVLDVEGQHAILEVYGVEPQTQHVRVPMVREGDAWRIEIEIPPASDALGAPGAASGSARP